MLQQLARLAEALLAGGTLEQALDAVHVLVVKQVGWLQEALIAEVALERTVCRVLVRAAVADQGVLLFKAHLALLALERSVLRVGALMLAQVRLALEALVARAAAVRTLPGRLALVVKQLGRLLEVHLAQVALEQVLARVGVHVAHQVGPMLKGFLTHGTLVRALGAVGALVVLQVGGLTEALVANGALEGLLTRVHALVARQFRQVTEALVAHGTLVRPVRSRTVIRGGGRPFAGVGRGRGTGVPRGARAVRLLTDGALHGVASGVFRVMLRQRGEQREPHLAHATHKRLLLHLNTLVLQEVSCLLEDLHALGALEGAVLVHHALVLVRVGQV